MLRAIGLLLLALQLSCAFNVRVSRRAALTTAATTAASAALPASAETPEDVIRRLENSGVDRNPAGGDHSLSVSVTPSSMTALSVEVKVLSSTDDIEWIYLRKYTPDAPAGYVKVIAAKRFIKPPKETPTLKTFLPPGTKFTPVLSCKKYGLFEGELTTVPGSGFPNL